jgi:enoyl-CoA hydratase/3-hydroxyacyl-CoA dehydrogenase
MNALNPAVGAQFDAAVEHGKANGAGIVIGGSGKAFVAGADIKFFVDNLRADAFQDIYSFTKDGQMTLRKLSGGDKAVVARVQGLSLGGGSELALACDWIVASPKASFGFPETGIGIYPGLGGTQRLPRRVGLPLAKYLIFTGQSLSAKKALNIGLCDDVTDFASLDQACEKWAEKGSVQQRAVPTIAPSQDWELIWDFFSRWTVEQILSGDADSLGEPQLEKAVKLMGFKSANALKMAERLLNDGEGLELNAALDLELEHLETAFSHPDALEGLSSLIEGRRPAFVVGVSAI